MISVNLVPDDCLESWVRRRRLTWWASVSAVVTIVAIVACTDRLAAGHAVEQLREHISTLQARQANLERSLVLAGSAHDALLARAQSVASLEHQHDLPLQLAELARVAPGGVVFTRIETRRGDQHTSTRPRHDRHVVQPADQVLVTEMAGYAVDHRELDRLIQSIQTIPRWEQVRLLRASREPFMADKAIAFQIVCRPAETQP